MTSNVVLRDALRREQAHVIDSWARSFFRLTERTRMPISAYVWHRTHRAGISLILSEPSTRVVVACHTSHPDEILGWVCWQPPDREHQLYLHYVHVKRPYRRNGIGLSLAATATAGADERGVVATHRTWMWSELSAAMYEQQEQEQHAHSD